MYNTPVEILKARVVHQCTWCAELIQKRETYHRWTTFDDSATVSKMHPECVEACSEECREWNDDEYIRFQGERPKTERETP